MEDERLAKTSRSPVGVSLISRGLLQTFSELNAHMFLTAVIVKKFQSLLSILTSSEVTKYLQAENIHIPL
jgi:hypothetical protein